MLRMELRVLTRLQRKDLTIGELVRELGKSERWISEVVSDLGNKDLVEKRNGKVGRSHTYSHVFVKPVV